MGRFQFDFALSFAEEDAEHASKLKRILEAFGAHVYDYRDWQAEYVGKDIPKELAKVYTKQSRFFIPIVSEFYVQKDYTRYEFDLAREERRKRTHDYILPIRLDGTHLVGASSATGYIDLRKVPQREAARRLITKLGLEYPDRGKHITPTLWVAAFGVAISALRENAVLPRDAPTDYARLCDWLQQDISNRLRGARLKNWGFTEDFRDGETYSVRVAFQWRPSKTKLSFGDLSWWDVLEVEPFEKTYPNQAEGWTRSGTISDT